jgi:hypothetical protein
MPKRTEIQAVCIFVPAIVSIEGRDAAIAGGRRAASRNSARAQLPTGVLGISE